MRMSVLALSVISVTLAGTTAYFARELHLERERSRATPPTVARLPPAVPAQEFQPDGTQAPATTTAQKAMTPPPATAESEEARMKRAQAESGRKLLAALEDPQRREGMLIQMKMAMRSSYPRLAQAIGMTVEETERLYTLLAQQQIESQEWYSRCAIDPDCDNATDTRLRTDPRAQEIANLLGAERAQQFEAYKSTLTERESVVHLRTRLSDSNRLPDDKAEALISTLADERQRIYQEASLRDAGINGHGTGVGVIFFASDARTPEAKFESAQANSRRMSERAAAVLTAEQLRVFDEMQAELLISLREQIFRKEDPSTS